MKQKLVFSFYISNHSLHFKIQHNMIAKGTYFIHTRMYIMFIECIYLCVYKHNIKYRI